MTRRQSKLQESAEDALRHRPAAIALANRLGRPWARLTPSLTALTDHPDAEAIAETAPDLGLSAEAFRLALARLTESLEGEAHLTPIGAAAAATQLRQLLAARRAVQAALAARPAVKEAPIARPVFITGLPRTGSTLLHNLMAQDPNLATPRTWEVMYPTPAPGRDPGADRCNRRRCARRLRLVDYLAPMFRRIHPVGADLPQECIAITAMAFMSIVFHTTYRVPGYQAWLESVSQEEAYRFHRCFLRHLGRHRRAGRWVLKAPGHLMSLNSLLRVYPDACVVHTHRDPLRVAASIASHGVVLRWAFSDRVDPSGVGSYWKEYWARHLDAAVAARRNIPACRLVDIRYQDLLGDPIGAVARIYAAFDLPLQPAAERAMRRFLAENPQHKHGRHRYSLRQFGFKREDLERRFAAYRDRFEIQSEVS